MHVCMCVCVHACMRVLVDSSQVTCKMVVCIGCMLTADSCSTMECRCGVKEENLALFIKQEPDDVCCYINIIYFYYIRQVNGAKLADILFYLRFCPSVRPSIRPSVLTHI